MGRPAAVILLTFACCGGTNVTNALDGGTRFVDAAPAADVIGQDAPLPISSVDFAASGCQSFDPVGPSCGGTAPLDLRFTAIAPSPIDTWVWTFGDGFTSTQPLPLHRFNTPGAFTVRLTVGTSAGTAQVQKDMFVLVTAAPLGAPCGTDQQCQAGLSCICASGDACPPSLARGFCSRGCSGTNPCPSGSTCANLSPNGALGGWQRNLCLPSCTSDGMCGGGFRCRELRSGSGNGWIQACFAGDVLYDEGSSCLNGSGATDGNLCASGICNLEGARGLCGRPCGASSPCPSYAACATFETGPSVCLARCNTVHPCTADPWLDCEPPNPTGSLGFTVTETPLIYCAPKRCASSAACGPDGTCSGDGFCGP